MHCRPLIVLHAGWVTYPGSQYIVQKYQKLNLDLQDRFHILLQLKVLPNFPCPPCLCGVTYTDCRSRLQKSRCLSHSHGFQEVCLKNCKKIFNTSRRPTAVTGKMEWTRKAVKIFQPVVQKSHVSPHYTHVCTIFETGLKCWEKMGLREWHAQIQPLNSMEIRPHKIVSCLPTLWCPRNSKPDWQVQENGSPDRPETANTETRLCAVVQWASKKGYSCFNFAVSIYTNFFTLLYVLTVDFKNLPPLKQSVRD